MEIAAANVVYIRILPGEIDSITQITIVENMNKTHNSPTMNANLDFNTAILFA